MSDMTSAAADQMDRIYRFQRHIYDLTRKNFLLGRDTLIAGLLPPDDGIVVEVGCGTARNLIEAARAYPRARFHGFDISAAMLETARQRITAAGLADRIVLAQGDATRFDLQSLFGVPAADRIFVSYALSMIPPWPTVLETAARQLSSRGQLHVVDFGQLEGYPRLFRRGLEGWLHRFAVHPSPELERTLRQVALTHGLDAFVTHPHRGYATYATLQRR